MKARSSAGVTRRGRARGLGLLAAAMTALLVFAGTASAQGEGQVSLTSGTVGPGAALEDLDGNPVDLSAFFVADVPTLIEFWASWCENCEALQPQLDEIKATYGERVTVIAVAVAVSQSLRRVKRHVEEHGASYPYLWDARGNAVRAYEAPTTSVVVILDRAGHVAYTGVGAGQDLVGAMADVVGG